MGITSAAQSCQHGPAFWTTHCSKGITQHDQHLHELLLLGSSPPYHKSVKLSRRRLIKENSWVSSRDINIVYHDTPYHVDGLDSSRSSPLGYTEYTYMNIWNWLPLNQTLGSSRPVFPYTDQWQLSNISGCHHLTI